MVQMQIYDKRYIMEHLWSETKWSSGTLVIFLVWSGLACSGLALVSKPSSFPDEETHLPGGTPAADVVLAKVALCMFWTLYLNEYTAWPAHVRVLTRCH
jgi:hypothetical protein